MTTDLTMFNYIDAYYPLVLTIISSIIVLRWWLNEVL